MTNQRHERFAQELAKGKSALEAYQLAGYKPRKSNGARLRSLPAIRKRYHELMEAAARHTEVTAASVMAELATIAFANLGNFMKVGPDGLPYADFSALTPEQSAALTEVTVDEYKAGRGADGREVRRVRFKLGEKRAALADLAKMLGLFRERVEVSNESAAETKEPPSDFELARRIAFLLAKAAHEMETASGATQHARLDIVDGVERGAPNLAPGDER